ncbi:NCAM-related adhesion molecule, partial [Elysia marginata]
ISLSGDDDTLYRDYICEADNGQTAVRTVTLKKATAPAEPNLKLIDSLSTTVELEVQKPSNNGGQPVTSYNYKYYSLKDPGNVKQGVLNGESLVLCFFRVGFNH